MTREEFMDIVYSELRSDGDNYRANRIIDAADEYAEEQTRWISCKDRLPEEKGLYLVTYYPCYWDDVDKSKICVGIDTFRGKTTWAQKKYQRVIAWMPLPEPYQPKEDEE